MDFKSKVRELYRYEKEGLFDKALLFDCLCEFKERLASIIVGIKDEDIKQRVLNAIHILEYALYEQKLKRQIIAFDTAAHIIHPIWNESESLGRLVVELKERRWNEGA